MRTPLFVRTYDFILWLFPHTAKFPRTRRHTLTNRLERVSLDFQGTAALANRTRGPRRKALLHEADGLLDQWCFLMRLSTDLGHLSGRQYEFAAKKLDEIGRLLGAWKKTATGPG